jgi:hypothetical protein
MKKRIMFCILLFVFGIAVYSQTWTVYGDDDWDYEYTKITREQFNRIVTANETRARGVMIDFLDGVEQEESGRIINGSRPSINGYYYLLVKTIPKTNDARIITSIILSTVIYGNTRTGQMTIQFLTTIPDPEVISLYYNRNEYVRRYNIYIGLVNGE